MSIALMVRSWSLELRTTIKFVLVALSDNANDEGLAFPSIRTLMRKCSLSERAVQAAIAELAELGHVTRIDRPGRSTLFRIHPRTTCTPAGDAPPQEEHPPPHEVHPTPARGAPTPAPRAPITSTQPSLEPSLERRARKRAITRASKRCPPGFIVTPQMRAWASTECPTADIDRETAMFRDHEFARTRTDWLATWRNWMRRGSPDATRRSTPSAVAPTTEQRDRLRAWATDPETCERWPNIAERIVRAPMHMRWPGYHIELQQIAVAASESQR